MRRSFILAVFMITALTLASEAGAQQAGKPARQRQIICKDAAVPAGWILVDDLRDRMMCGGSSAEVVNAYNVWAIEKFDGAPVGTVLTVCANTRIPAGWNLLDVYRDKSMCGHPDDLFATNVKIIRKAK